MKLVKSLAISFAGLLLLSALTANVQAITLTFLTLDPVPAVAAAGDEVVFTGKLTDINGNALVGKTIRIDEERATGPNILATAVTDENGMFSTSWMADLDNPTKDRNMSISATFAGDEQYNAARSGRVGMKVAIQTMSVSINFDKPFYFSGDRATFTIKFASPRGEAFDPEVLRGIFDGLTVTLERQEGGHYIFKTPPLVPPTHTLQIVAEKHGYKVFTNAVTIDVFTRQALPGVKLDFAWSPEQVLQGVPVTFTLAFTDSNNIVAPFVNYDIAIRKGSEVVLELKNQQTTDGKATHQHTFADGGKYVVNVKINGIGQAPDLILVRLSSDFNIDVIKSTAFAVKVKALQKGDTMRVVFRNPMLAPTGVYAVSLNFEDPNKVIIRAPSGWTVRTVERTIKIETGDSPLEPGKNLRLSVKVDGTVDSFDWGAMDGKGTVLKSGTAKVRVIAS